MASVICSYRTSNDNRFCHGSASDISGKGSIRLDAELSAVEMMAAAAASKMAAIQLSVQRMAGCRHGWQVRRYCRLQERRSRFDSWRICVFGGGESDGGVGCEEGKGWKVADDGGGGVEHRIGGGEMDISLFSSQSRRSSTSFLRFLSFFRGGGALSGDCMSIAFCGVGPAVGVAVGDVARSGTPGAAVAALPHLRRRRWRRRRFPAAVVNSAGTGKVHDIDSVWRPAAWLKTTRAFKPLAEHGSYSAVKNGSSDGWLLQWACIFHHARSFSSDHACPRGGAWRVVGVGMGQLIPSRHSQLACNTTDGGGEVAGGQAG